MQEQEQRDDTNEGMPRGHAVLEKRLVELESELKQVLEIPLETTCYDNDELSLSMHRKLGFLKNFLSQEMKSHPNEHQNLLDLDQRLNQLEKVFQEWDSGRTSVNNDIDTSSTCSCTESCLDERSSGSQDMGTDSPVLNKQDYGIGLSDLGLDSIVCNEPKKSVPSLDMEVDSPVQSPDLKMDSLVPDCVRKDAPVEKYLHAMVTGGKTEKGVTICRGVRMFGKARRYLVLMSVIVVVCGAMTITRIYDFCHCDVEMEIFPIPT